MIAKSISFITPHHTTHIQDIYYEGKGILLTMSPQSLVGEKLQAWQGVIGGVDFSIHYKYSGFVEGAVLNFS